MADLSWLTDMLPGIGQAGLSAIQAYLTQDAAQDASASQIEAYQNALNTTTGNTAQAWCRIRGWAL